MEQVQNHRTKPNLMKLNDRLNQGQTITAHPKNKLNECEKKTEQYILIKEKTTTENLIECKVCITC